MSERNESVVDASLATAPMKVRSQDTPLEKTSPTETPAKPTDSIWKIGIISKKAQEDLAASSGVGINPPPEHDTLAWNILHFFQRGPPMPCGQWVNVPILLKHAEQALGLNIKYNEEQLSLLDLHNFSTADYGSNDEALARGESLEDIIEKQLIPRRMHGAKASTIREVFKDDPGIEATITLLAEGQQPFMKPQFKPNGGKEVSWSFSYLRMRPVCNDALLQLNREGKLLVVSQVQLRKSGQDGKVHIKGRTCLHASAGSKHHPSYNDSIDLQAHDARYRSPNLTSLPKLCELACKQRQRYAKARLCGAVVDVCSAYTQVAQSVETAKTHCVEIQAPHPSLIDAVIILVAVFLCVIFGDSRAGNVYCICAESIHRQHNAEYCRSETYIYDGCIIDA
jgi:hypothetical protein